MKHRHLRAWFSAMVIGTAALVGCGGDGPTASTGTTGAGTSSSATGTGGAGGEGTGTSTGTGGEGGAGGGQAAMGAPGTALVNGGHVISSAKYKMVFTVGQSSPVQTNVSSPTYTLRGGLIGATGAAK